MSVVGLCLILAAGFGCVYFGISLFKDIKERKNQRKPTDKK